MEYGIFLNGELVTGGYDNPIDAYHGAINGYKLSGLFYEVKLIKEKD